MDILEEEKKKTKDKLPFAVFVASKSIDDTYEDYKQIFTDIISDKIKENDIFRTIVPINSPENDTIKLNKNETSIFELIKNNPKITREQIIDKLGISDRTASRIIKKLQEMELIERIGVRKTGYWQIKK